ncbi:hypothetical protein [Salinispora fenicalii]|uniref:hypothetical protein n=1 Tax=Salinispora fenicalii TaxID=1137263 RepID=UPI0004B2A963|nr:hypothetical protein [Salinispora fenicalii]
MNTERTTVGGEHRPVAGLATSPGYRPRLPTLAGRRSGAGLGTGPALPAVVNGCGGR